MNLNNQNNFISKHNNNLPGHEIKEAVKLDVAGGVGVNNGQDSLEVDLTLLVLNYYFI